MSGSHLKAPGFAWGYLLWVPQEATICAIELQAHYCTAWLLPVLAGNSNWKIEPLDAPADAQIGPSWLSMIERQIERPIPMPCALVVNSGLKTRSILSWFNSAPAILNGDLYAVLSGQLGSYGQNTVVC